MEPADFAVKIEEVMAEECTEYECVFEDEEEIGRIWNFILDDSISGYVGLEDNEETLGIQTVSVGIHLQDVTDLPREDIVNLFSANAEFINATLSIINIPLPVDSDEEVEVDEDEDEEQDDDQEPEVQLRELLIIQSRFLLESFDPADLRSHIDNMLFQHEAILGTTDDEDEESEDNGILDVIDDILDGTDSKDEE